MKEIRMLSRAEMAHIHAVVFFRSTYEKVQKKPIIGPYIYKKPIVCGF